MESGVDVANPPRRVLLAAPRGFCAGVDRAISMVELALQKHGKPVYVRRQIVHNTHVVRRLAALGAVFVEELDEVPAGAVAVLSAHGVSPEVRAEGDRRGLHLIDATCPLVMKVHQEARRFAANGREILLVGHQGHEEVIGTAGHAPGQVRVVESVAAARELALDEDAETVWLSQTTLSVDETMEVVAELRGRMPALLDPPSDDICYASQNRQEAVKRIAAESQLVLIVGSANSSNSVRLVEVALASGAEQAHLIDDATEIRPEWLDNVGTVGLSSGASAPESLVQEVLELLRSHGFGQVDTVLTAEEDVVFAVPAALRPTARQAAGDAPQPDEP